MIKNLSDQEKIKTKDPRVPRTLKKAGKITHTNAGKLQKRSQKKRGKSHHFETKHAFR